MKKIFVILLVIQISKNHSIAQSVYAHAKIQVLQHQYPKILGQGLEIGGSLKSKNQHFKISLAYYNYISKGALTSAKVVNNNFAIATYNHTRSEEGLKLGFGYRFNMSEKWKIETDLSLLKANIEIISQDKYFPIKSGGQTQNIPFPAYYAYRDYLGQADVSVVRLLKKNHEILFNVFYAQSPWNPSLSRNCGGSLGINLNIFNIK